MDTDFEYYSTRPLRLLALDGGGVRAISELRALHVLMLKIQWAKGLPETPKPCEYFDLIGGTSTGGIIAILLGRLRFSVEMGLRFFVSLSEGVYRKERWGWGLWQARFDHKILERAIILLLQSLIGPALPTLTTNVVRATVGIETAHSSDQGLLDPRNVRMHDNHPRRCNTFVIATSTREIQTCVLRTYHHRGVVKNRDCKVWEAMRATSAAPTVFDPIQIEGEIFFDGGVRCDNPASIVYEEARELWPNRDIGCIISLGTGTPSSSENTTLFDRMFPWNSNQAWGDIETECEITHKDMCRRRELKGKYFRLNPKEWLQSVSLEDWLKLYEVIGIMDIYLQEGYVEDMMDEIVAKLVTLDDWHDEPDIDGTVQF